MWMAHQTPPSLRRGGVVVGSRWGLGVGVGAPGGGPASDSTAHDLTSLRLVASLSKWGITTLAPDTATGDSTSSSHKAVISVHHRVCHR